MKAICSKTNLLNCINTVQKAVSVKSTIQILEGILIKAYDDKLTMLGNDLEISIECSINADIIQEGSLVVNSKMLGEIVRNMPDADVEIDATRELVEIKCAHTEFKLNFISADGFPEPQNVEKTGSFEIPAKELRENIRKTIIAVSTDENRPTLTGVLFEISDDNLTLVAIDGFRMALRETEIKGNEGSKKLVVPGKTLSELIKIIDLGDDMVKIGFSDNHIVFETEDKKLISRLLEGEFPKYRSIIPSGDETTITAKRTELLGAIERAAIVSSDDKRYPVVLNIENDMIYIKLHSDNASLEEEVSVDMTGEKVKIGFNPKFLIDALKVIEDEEILITLRGSVGPCLLKPMEGEDYLYLVVPVKIQNMR